MRLERARRAVARRLYPIEFQPVRFLVDLREQIIGPDGEILLDSGWTPNVLTDEGESSMLNVYFREQSNVTKYLACLNQASPTDTTTMATMTESKSPGADGYNRQQILAADWSAPSLDSGDMQTSAAEKTFGPITGTAMTVSHVALVTVATGTSGLFLLYVTPSATRTIDVGLSYKTTLRSKQS